MWVVIPPGPIMAETVVEITGEKKMNIPSASVKELLEAGVHLGHKTFRWNPKNEEIYFWRKKLNSHY